MWSALAALSTVLAGTIFVGILGPRDVEQRFELRSLPVVSDLRDTINLEYFDRSVQPAYTFCKICC